MLVSELGDHGDRSGRDRSFGQAELVVHRGVRRELCPANHRGQQWSLNQEGQDDDPRGDEDFEVLGIITEAVKEMSEGELLQIEKARNLNLKLKS